MELSREEAAASTAQRGKMAAVSKAKEIESMILAGGFEFLTLFYQLLFIQA